MKRDELPSLILLPAPPSPLSRSTLSAAYRPSLTAALSRLRSPARCTTLIVGVACPLLRGPSRRTKTLSWSETQSLLAGLYSIIALVCAQLGIGTDVDGGAHAVDGRVVLIDHDRSRRIAGDLLRPAVEPNNTVVVDLPTFAAAYHPWNLIFAVNCEAGLELHSQYLRLAEGKQTLLQEQLVTVDAGTYIRLANAESGQEDDTTPTRPIVCLGGTFDHLHPGHKLLLTAGALLLDVPDINSKKTCTYIIGITGDELLKKKKYVEFMQSWEVRARNTIHFLSSILALSPSGWKDGMQPPITEKDGDFRAEFRNGTITIQCVRFQDVYGPTITMEDIMTLVVSWETRSGARAVNEKRTELGWRALEVFEVDVLDAEENGDLDGEAARTDNLASKISSTAIRQLKAEGR